MKRLSVLFLSLCLTGMVLSVIQCVTAGSRTSKDPLSEFLKKAAEQADDDCSDEAGDDDPQTCSEKSNTAILSGSNKALLFSVDESHYALELAEKFSPPPRS